MALASGGVNMAIAYKIAVTISNVARIENKRRIKKVKKDGMIANFLQFLFDAQIG